jgi:hypothetical protein
LNPTSFHFGRWRSTPPCLWKVSRKRQQRRRGEQSRIEEPTLLWTSLYALIFLIVLYSLVENDRRISKNTASYPERGWSGTIAALVALTNMPEKRGGGGWSALPSVFSLLSAFSRVRAVNIDPLPCSRCLDAVLLLFDHTMRSHRRVVQIEPVN